MSTLLTYRPLCTVCLWHGYYLHPPDTSGNALNAAEQETAATRAGSDGAYYLGKELRIEPTAVTREIMAGKRLLFRPESSGFSLWTRVKKTASGFQPLTLSDAPFSLRFALHVKNPAFYVFTQATRPASQANTVWYFSNRAGNRIGNTNYLNTTGHYASDEDWKIISPGEEDLPSGAFSIVEICHRPGLGHYALFDAAQNLLSPVYTLWWQNRLTYWRYLFDKDQPAPVAGSDVKPDGTGQNRLVTEKPFPLQNRYRPVRYFISAGEQALLPNPEPYRIYPEGKDFFSEVYMNKIDFKKRISGTH